MVSWRQKEAMGGSVLCRVCHGNRAAASWGRGDTARPPPQGSGPLGAAPGGPVYGGGVPAVPVATVAPHRCCVPTAASHHVPGVSPGPHPPWAPPTLCHPEVLCPSPPAPSPMPYGDG